jgi:hypothetical protein
MSSTIWDVLEAVAAASVLPSSLGAGDCDVVGVLDVVGVCDVVRVLDMVGVCDVVGVLDVVRAGDVVRTWCSRVNSSSSGAGLPPPLFQSHPRLSSKTTSRETRTR